METAWLSTEGLCQQHRASQQRLGGTISCMQAVRASSYSTWVCCSHLIHVFSLLTRESESGSVMANSLWPHEFRCLCLWNSLGKHTEVGCHTLLQGIFPNQRLNLGVLHCRQILCHLSHLGSPETPPQTPYTGTIGVNKQHVDSESHQTSEAQMRCRSALILGKHQ